MLAAGTAQAAIPRILYVGDSWTQYPWSQEPPALREVLSREYVIAAVGGEYEEVGDIALHGATAADWDTPSLKQEITDKLNEYPTIDTVHMSLGGNDLNMWVAGDFSSGHINSLVDTTTTHIRNVIDHCLSVRPDVRVAICGYDYINLAEGYEFEDLSGVGLGPMAVMSIEEATALMLVAWGLNIQIYLPDYPWLGGSTIEDVEANQVKVNNVFIQLERAKKDLALSMDRVRYVHNFGLMQSFYGIPSLLIPPNGAYVPDGPAQGYANFPAGLSNRFSPKEEIGRAHV